MERMKELFTTEEVVKAKTKRTAEVVLGKDGDGEEPETKRPREDLEMEASIAEVTILNCCPEKKLALDILLSRLGVSPLWKTSECLLEGEKP